MKNMQSLLLMLLIFLAVCGVNAVLGVLVFSYALISEFGFVILYSVSIPILGMLFSKIRFSSVIYKIGGLSLIVGFLGLFYVVFYSIFVEKIDEKVLYLFVSITSTGMIIIYLFFKGERIK
jgi:hypothetical protein